MRWTVASPWSALVKPFRNSRPWLESCLNRRIKCFHAGDQVFYTYLRNSQNILCLRHRNSNLLIFYGVLCHFDTKHTHKKNNILKDIPDEEDGSNRDNVEWLMGNCDYVEQFGNFTLLKWSDFRRQESVNGYILVSSITVSQFRIRWNRPGTKEFQGAIMHSKVH